MYLLQGQRLDWGEGGTAAYEDVAEVRAAGLGSTSAPPTHPRSQFFLSLSVFLAALFVYCSLTYFSRLTPLCFLVFSFRNLAFHFCPPVSFILCLFIALDWACIRSISNANGATWRYISNVLPIANLFKGTIFNPVLLCVFHQGRHNPHNKEDRIKWKRSTLWFGRK